MRSKISFLLLGDSAAGKSTFIRNFCIDKDLADLLNITGSGQTTRCNIKYVFTTDSSVETKVEVDFLSEEDFVHKYVQLILNEREISEENFLSEIESILCSDIISNEYIKLNEFGLRDDECLLIKSIDVSEIINFSQLLDLLAEKLKTLYNLLLIKINQILDIFSKNLTNLNRLDFSLTSEQESDLLVFCSKKAARIVKRKYNTEISSVSGLVKGIKIVLPMHKLYAEICNKIGFRTLEFIDTYGLNHDGQTIEQISLRFQNIFGIEFRDIDSVLFVAPMTGNAAKTNDKFTALIEAKRSIIPQIVYTKLDKYVEEEGFEFAAIDESDISGFIEEFNINNRNEITDDFAEILNNHYSKDIADYRRKRIMESITYFAAVYEKGCDTEKAININTKSFISILISILKSDNFEISLNMVDRLKFEENLKSQLYKESNTIEEKLKQLFENAKEVFNKNYSSTHTNTKNAFLRRKNSNMFGFYDIKLNLQIILTKSYTSMLAIDTGTHREDNFGSLIINDYFIKNNLEVFIRECINKFGSYLFCFGCSPCDSLKIDRCEMSTFCNNSGAKSGQRIKRQEKCYHYNSGFDIGSQEKSIYCTNTGIFGSGLFDKAYGQEHSCINDCYWSAFFDNINSNKDNIFSDCLSFESFTNLFIKFSLLMLENANKNAIQIDYIENMKITDETANPDNKKVEYEKISELQKKYILITEGVSDKIHIELAWTMLRREEIPFDIYSCGGADSVAAFLKSYPPGMFKDKVFIGLLDYDSKGVKVFRGFKKKNNEKDEKDCKFIKYINNNEKKYYVCLLPNKNEDILNYLAGVIEFLYPIEILKKYGIIQKRSIGFINNLEYVKENELYLSANKFEESTDIELHEVKDDIKINFANEVRKESRECFIGFECLLSTLQSIVSRDKI